MSWWKMRKDRREKDTKEREPSVEILTIRRLAREVAGRGPIIDRELQAKRSTQ